LTYDFLGKTIETITFLNYLVNYKGNKGIFLIICPLSTVMNWEHEFEIWAPSIKVCNINLIYICIIEVIAYKGSKEYRSGIWNSNLKKNQLYANYHRNPSLEMAYQNENSFFLSYNVILTTYQLVMIDYSRFKKIRYNYIIVDEGL
jgi:SNF2 family DNA or RNA helicase